MAIFSNFSTMRERGVRELTAGGKTGHHGTDSVEHFGYINHLKICSNRCADKPRFAGLVLCKK